MKRRGKQNQWHGDIATLKKALRTFRGSSGLVTGNMYRKKRIVTTGRTIKFRPYSLPHQSQLHQKNWLKLCTFMNN